MNKKNIFGFLAGIIFSLVIVLSSPASPVSAEIISDPLAGLNQTANNVNAFVGDVAKQDSYYQNFLATKAGQVVGLILSFIGVIFLGLMIYAGITWMTSEGNEQKISKAKSLIIDSIIGIIIVFGAYVLTTFIGSEVLK